MLKIHVKLRYTYDASQEALHTSLRLVRSGTDDEKNYYLSAIDECNDENDGCDDDLDEHNLENFWNIGREDEDEHHILSISRPSSHNEPSGSYAAQVNNPVNQRKGEKGSGEGGLKEDCLRSSPDPAQEIAKEGRFSGSSATEGRGRPRRYLREETLIFQKKNPKHTPPSEEGRALQPKKGGLRLGLRASVIWRGSSQLLEGEASCEGRTQASQIPVQPPCKYARDPDVARFRLSCRRSRGIRIQSVRDHREVRKDQQCHGDVVSSSVTLIHVVAPAMTQARNDGLKSQAPLF
ncbi:hypothetical protein VNO77_30801 [Canavalia gladiata]|uniref:Uncharacterized protein n=1 Tax=Canavalia gladiata TaxID=3824 RepID=A0AAN9KRX2_CANGL